LAVYRCTFFIKKQTSELSCQSRKDVFSQEKSASRAEYWQGVEGGLEGLIYRPLDPGTTCVVLNLHSGFCPLTGSWQAA